MLRQTVLLHNLGDVFCVESRAITGTPVLCCRRLPSIRPHSDILTIAYAGVWSARSSCFCVYLLWYCFMFVLINIFVLVNIPIGYGMYMEYMLCLVICMHCVGECLEPQFKKWS